MAQNAQSEADILANLRAAVMPRFERGANVGSLDGDGIEAGAAKMARGLAVQILAGLQLKASLKGSHILELVEGSLGRTARFAEEKAAKPAAVASPNGNGKSRKAVAAPVAAPVVAPVVGS